MVQALIVRAGQALWHEADEFGPDLLGTQMAGLRARNRLDVGREAFFDPVMLGGDRWKRQVHQFVNHDPIVGELSFGDGAAEHDAYRRAAIRERGSGTHARAVDRHDQDLDAVDREAAVVSGDGPARGRDPVDDDAARQFERPRRKRDVEGRFADHHPRGLQAVKRLVRHATRTKRVRIVLACGQSQGRHGQGREQGGKAH